MPVSMIRVAIHMKHVSMMHACVMHVKNGDGRTDGKLNSRSRMLTASDIYVNSPILVIIVITMTTTVAIIITNLSVQKLGNASDNGNKIDQCLLFQS